MPDFAIHASSVRDHTLLSVIGELDVATAPQVDRAAAEAVRTGCPVVVDLTSCTFLDSAGCRAVGHVARNGHRAGLDVALVCPASTHAVRRVVDLIGLSVLMPVLDSLEEALVR